MSYELLATSQCFPPAVDFVSGAYAGTEYRGTREAPRTNQWFGGDFSNDAAMASDARPTVPTARPRKRGNAPGVAALQVIGNGRSQA
jgi:hypothetical protein